MKVFTTHYNSVGYGASIFTPHPITLVLARLSLRLVGGRHENFFIYSERFLLTNANEAITIHKLVRLLSS